MLRFSLDGEKYEFDEARIMNVEAIAVKRVTSEGLGFVEWMKALSESDPEAVTALVWIVRKRVTPELKFSEVEFNLMEFISTLESETDVESDPTDSTTTLGVGSQPSPITSESESGSSPS